MCDNTTRGATRDVLSVTEEPQCNRVLPIGSRHNLKGGLSKDAVSAKIT